MQVYRLLPTVLATLFISAPSYSATAGERANFAEMRRQMRQMAVQIQNLQRKVQELQSATARTQVQGTPVLTATPALPPASAASEISTAKSAVPSAPNSAVSSTVTSVANSAVNSVDSVPVPAGDTGFPATVGGVPVAERQLSNRDFNPAISLILSGMYGNYRHDPQRPISGFPLPDGVAEELQPSRGFSLAESELGISANIDHLFYGNINVAIHPDNSVSAEEAYVQTSAIANGATLKAGRFFSGIGYLNEQHAHTWDFNDAPLAYQAFLGGQMNNDGVQLRWLAPTDTFIELGGEIGRNANYPGTDRNKNGIGGGAMFVHVGGDVGTNNSWRTGLSYAYTSPQGREWAEYDRAAQLVNNQFSGRSRLWIVDGVWKWAPNGNASRTNFKLQGEYLYRREHGQLAYDINSVSGGSQQAAYEGRQSAWYLQGIYQWAPNWRVGLRTEQLQNGKIDYGENGAFLKKENFKPRKHSVMFDYNPSEFSRIRLQLARDQSTQGIIDQQISVLYQMSLGAHGAHKF